MAASYRRRFGVRCCIECGAEYVPCSKAQAYCSKGCATTRRNRRPLAARFWEKVDRSGECWLWTASRDEWGYGRLKTEFGHHAHRIAYALTNGPIPTGLIVMHHCDTPACVRPDHLFLGTHADNAHDRDRKGRAAKPPKAPGTLCHFSRLTDAEVIEIRRRYAAGARQVDLAAAFGVSDGAIYAVVHERSWRHLLAA